MNNQSISAGKPSAETRKAPTTARLITTLVIMRLF